MCEERIDAEAADGNNPQHGCESDSPTSLAVARLLDQRVRIRRRVGLVLRFGRWD
jgi:hypothetical protein